MKPYDPSTDYGRYPTLAPLPEELTGRFARCEGCGGVDFRFRLPDWAAVRKKCGAKLALPAQKPASKLTQTAPPPKVSAKRELPNIQIVGALEHTVLLRPDGTVRARGNNYYGQCNVSDWSDIVAISAVSGRTTGLRRDGTVVIVGENSSFHNVSGWSDITALSASYCHSVGLRADGTVVATGDNGNDCCNVQQWTNVSKIWALPSFTAAMQHDGTILCTNPAMKQWILDALS